MKLDHADWQEENPYESLGKPLSLVNQIYKSLGRAIAKGHLRTGQHLKEADLQKAFGVSRAPIREALRMLESDDLVVADAYKKKYVRPITRKYIEDLIPVMAALESLAAAIAANKLTDAHVASLRQLNNDMLEAYQQEHYELCAELNFDFHKTYVKAADNQVIHGTIRSLKKAIVWFWMCNFYYRNHDVIPISIREHERIIESFAARDSVQAEHHVRAHVTGIVQKSLESASFDSDGLYITAEPTEKATEE